MNYQQQIKEIEKHASTDMPPEVLFEMNRKYRELEEKINNLIKFI